MNKKRVITFLSLIVVTLCAIAGCSFLSPTIEQGNTPANLPNLKQENVQLTKQMDDLQKKDLIVADTRRDLLSNRLVLIVPADKSDAKELKDLTNASIERIAIGAPRSVPVGQYAEQALKKLELLQDLQSKFVLGNNVRQVLQFVESGNAQAGIVYVTDAKTSTKVKVVQVIDAKLHKPIVYPIAVLQKSSNQPSAKSYLEFLSSEPAKTIFEKYGFSTL